MKENNQKSLIADQQNKLRLWQIGFFAMAISNVLLVVLANGLNKPEKTIITPLEVRNAFWVEGSRVSPQYLMDMGKYFANELLTYNPESAPGQFETVLKYVEPGASNALRRQFQTDLDQIRSRQMASVYWIKQMKVKGNTVLIYGTKRNMMAGSSLGDEGKGYEIVFKFDTRLRVASFKEIPMPAGGIEEYERMQSMVTEAESK